MAHLLDTNIVSYILKKNATAITLGIILVSNDSDLQRVEGLSLEN